MIALGSKTAPLLGIAHHFGIPYEQVLETADMYRYIEFGDTHLFPRGYRPEDTLKRQDQMDPQAFAHIYDAVCAHKAAQGKFSNNG